MSQIRHKSSEFTGIGNVTSRTVPKIVIGASASRFPIDPVPVLCREYSISSVKTVIFDFGLPFVTFVTLAKCHKCHKFVTHLNIIGLCGRVGPRVTEIVFQSIGIDGTGVLNAKWNADHSGYASGGWWIGFVTLDKCHKCHKSNKYQDYY